MAIANDIPEIYICETDADRESIVPYAGQKCIMQNGDIYVCFRAGVWGKIGEEPTPPTPPTPTGLLTIETDELVDISGYGGGQVFGEYSLGYSMDYKLALVAGNTYKMSFVTANETYELEAIAEDQQGIAIMLRFEDGEGFLHNECHLIDVLVFDGAKADPDAGMAIGDYSLVWASFDEGGNETFKSAITEIILDNAEPIS